MPRPSLGARLYFSEDDGFWYIRDGQRKRSTGCPGKDRDRAEQALAEYLASKHEPSFGRGDPDEVTIADVLLHYATERIPEVRRPDVIRSAVKHLGRFWAGKKVGQVTPELCAKYIAWRTSQAQARIKTGPARNVGDQTARRELEVLSAAIGRAYKDRKIRYVVPVTLPQKSEARDRWLTRSEVARLLWAVWRQDQGKSRHLARFILIALYTGTRYDAVLRLRWTPAVDAGWVDLERGVIYRKGSGEKQTTKRRTPVPISDRLLAHLRRWRKSSTTHPIEYAEGPVLSVKRSWLTARKAAGLGPEVVPHILRHTFATWAIQDGQPFNKVAGALGTTERMVESVYGHHNPDHLRSVVNSVGRQRRLGA